MKNSSKVSLPTTTASSTDGRIALAWAWEFLRRNRCYRRDYRFSQRAPKIIRNDAIDLNAVTRKLSIRWLKKYSAHFAPPCLRPLSEPSPPSEPPSLSSQVAWRSMKYSRLLESARHEPSTPLLPPRSSSSAC